MAWETVALVIGSISVMPFWLLMIVVPRWALTEQICQQSWMVAPPVVLYALLLVGALFNGQVTAIARANLLDPASIGTLLGTPYVAVGAWLHLLAFDLWTGRWVYLDSRQQGLNTYGVSLVLVLVLCFGPLGLATYLFWKFSRQ
jgi:hypothetical protein